MLTVNTTNYNYPEYKPTFRGTTGKYKPIEKGLDALAKDLFLEEQEMIQTKMPKSNSGSKPVQFFRKLFWGSSANKQGTRYFKSKYGRFYLTDKGAAQYAKIMPELFTAKAKVRSLRFEMCKTYGDRNSLAANRATVGICLAKLDLLKSLGEIDAQSGQEHRFRSKYGKFKLTDKGLEQYLETVSALEKAKGMIKSWRSETCKTSDERNSLATNRATVGICLAKLGLLKSFGEIDTQSGQEHCFRSKYGKFKLTDKGLEQYLKIVSKLENAKRMVKSWRSETCKTSDERNSLATNRATVGICLAKLDLLKSFSEIDTTAEKGHRFKGKYGKFDLTDKGLEQYLDIVSKLKIAKGMVKSWRFETCKSFDEKNSFVKNKAAIATCEYKLDLLKSAGELPDNV